MTNTDFSKNNKEFLRWCEVNNKTPTSRISSKYRKKFHPVTRKKDNSPIQHLEFVGVSNRDPSEERFTTRSSR